MLTRKQQELLLFIHLRLSQGGVSPSFDEMKEALDLRSKSGIHRLVTALEERGFIRRLPHRARALEVIRLPDGVPGGSPSPAPALAAASPPAASPPRFQPNVIQGRFAPNLSGREIVAAADTIPLPLLGRIAAGTPIEALREQGTLVNVPASLLGPGEHYALQVAGDSMVDAGILDGDTVIIRRCDGAESGTIVVALVDDAEVTLKRLRRRGQSIALEPANANYETRLFPADRVRLQGRLVGLIRQY